MSEQMREEFESAVIERMKDGGFLEIEVRVEMLGRSGDGYSDCSVDTYWHYWQASRAALCVELPDSADEQAIIAIYQCQEAIRAAGVKTK